MRSMLAAKYQPNALRVASGTRGINGWIATKRETVLYFGGKSQVRVRRLYYFAVTCFSEATGNSLGLSWQSRAIIFPRRTLSAILLSSG
jgi:hypothetical protein